MKKVRPTMSRVADSLMNTLENIVSFEKATCLDLFCGTGSIGKKLLVKKAPLVFFVDVTFAPLKSEPIKTEYLKNAFFFKSSAFDFLKKTNETFDIIFADPPYFFKEQQYKMLVEKVFERKILKKNGVLIIEHSKEFSSESIKVQKVKKFGKTILTFFKQE